MKALVLGLSFVLATQAFGWTKDFGSEGRDGSAGESGRSGSSGQSVLIQASQGSQSFQLDGESGRDAYPGQDGEHANNCNQGRDEYDYKGANGGDAGSGGTGGSGGSGGDATIYYTDASQLKKISISAVPGRGGNGSYGGRGGEACFCRDYEWSIPKCREVIDPSGQKHRVCDRYERFTCKDGERGKDGANGSEGSDGSLGSITIIKSKTKLQSETPGLRVTLKELAADKDVSAVLTENLFARRQGALSLVASGSRISDYYTEFTRRAEEKVRVVWESKKPASSYSGTISASINNGEISFNVNTSEVLLTEERLENGVHTLYVKDAYNLSEFNILGLSTEGTRTNTVIRVKGTSPRLDLVQDTVYVTISRKRLLLGYKEVFRGQVPESLLQKSGKDLIVNVGQLRVEDPADTWKPKKEVKIEIQIIRRIKGSDDSIERKAVFINEQR
jgi:hypothetical protein